MRCVELVERFIEEESNQYSVSSKQSADNDTELRSEMRCVEPVETFIENESDTNIVAITTKIKAIKFHATE